MNRSTPPLRPLEASHLLANQRLLAQSGEIGLLSCVRDATAGRPTAPHSRKAMRNLTRISGTHDAPRLRHREVVEAFLLSTQDLPAEEVGRRAGVGAATVRRWRRSGVGKLRHDIHLRMLTHLAGREIWQRSR